MNEQTSVTYTGRGARVRLAALGGVQRLGRGTFVPVDDWNAAAWWVRHRLRIEAFRMRHPNAILSHASAAIAHGLPTFHDPGRVHAFRPKGQATHTTALTVWHASVDPRGVVETPLGPATSLIDTAIDLARTTNPAFALAVWDAVLRSGTVLDDLATRFRSQASRRGTVALDWLAETANGNAESPGESLSRAVMAWLGYQTPELQAEIHTPEGWFRADCMWRDSKTIGEFDGLAKYALGGGTPKDALREEKRREDAIRRAGFAVIRWEYRDVMVPDRLDSILRRGGLTPSLPRSLAALQRFQRDARTAFTA